MTIIQAAAMRCRTMADGSLRIEVEIEPNDAQSAFSLFGKPGTPMAITALKTGFAAVPDTPEEMKGGALARAAGMMDSNPEFVTFASMWMLSPRDLILQECGIKSRKELDHNPEAAEKFHQLMRDFNSSNRA